MAARLRAGFERLRLYVGALFLALCVSVYMSVPVFAQEVPPPAPVDPGGLGAGAKEAATNGVTLGAAVALVLIAAVIVYRLVKRFST